MSAVLIRSEVGAACGHVSLTVTAANRRYYLFVARDYVTVVTLPETRRSLGRTFHTLDELAKHYKRDGNILRDVVAVERAKLA